MKKVEDGVTETEVDMSGLPQGFYFLKINSVEKADWVPVVKQ